MPQPSEPEQQQFIAQLMEITQNSNPDQCAALLEAADWNLDTAVNLSFDGLPPPVDSRPAPPVAATQDTQLPRVNLMEELNRDLVTDAAPAIQNCPRHIVAQHPLLSLLFMPFKYAWSFFSLLFSRYYVVNRNALHTFNDQYDPKRVAARFKHRVEESLGGNHIEFFDGSYSQALQHSKDGLRLLLVVVLGWHHEDTAKALSWLKDQAIIDMTKRQNMIIWGGSLDTSEAYQVALGFKATKYPFIALVGPSPKTPQSNIVVMEILSKKSILSFDSPSDLAHTLEDKALAHEPKVLALRLDRERQDVDRDLRLQQDSAYEQSLARDRARAEEQASQALAASQQQAREERYGQNLIGWKIARARKFREHQPAGPTGRIQIRSPQGERLVAKFSEDDTVKTIYEYVFCRDQLAITDPSSMSDVEPAFDADFEPQFNFKLVSLMPRKVLEPTDSPLKNEPSFWPNGTLIIDEE